MKERLDIRSYVIDVNRQTYRRSRVDLRKTEQTSDNTRNVFWPRSLTKKASNHHENPERKKLVKQNLSDDSKAKAARSNMEVSGKGTRSKRQVKPAQKLNL